MNATDNIPGNFLLRKAFKQADVIDRWYSHQQVTDIRDIVPPARAQRKSTLFIVIHHDDIVNGNSYVPVFDILNYHLGKKYGSIAYHYYVTKAGKVYQFHDNESKTAHTEEYNDVAISICLSGKFDEQQIEELQYNALIRTIIMLKRIYPDAEIVGHGELTQTNCPGQNVNMPLIRKNVGNFNLLQTLINE